MQLLEIVIITFKFAPIMVYWSMWIIILAIMTQYSLLFSYGELGWHVGIRMGIRPPTSVWKRQCGDQFNILSFVRTADDLLHQEDLG